MELFEQAPKLQKVLEHVGKTYHRVFCHIKCQLYPSRSHVQSARAEKAGLQTGVERLMIPCRHCWALSEFFPYRRYQFRSDQVSAGFPGDHHEGLWFQILIPVQNASQGAGVGQFHFFSCMFLPELHFMFWSRYIGWICIVSLRIWLVISSAKSKARLADSPLTIGV